MVKKKNKPVLKAGGNSWHFKVLSKEKKRKEIIRGIRHPVSGDSSLGCLNLRAFWRGGLITDKRFQIKYSFWTSAPLSDIFTASDETQAWQHTKCSPDFFVLCCTEPISILIIG